MRAYRHIHRQLSRHAHYNTSHPYRGKVNIDNNMWIDHRHNYHGTGPQLLSRGPISYLSPQLLAVVSCEKCSLVDFVTYAMMKVVHELQQCTSTHYIRLTAFFPGQQCTVVFENQ